MRAAILTTECCFSPLRLEGRKEDFWPRIYANFANLFCRAACFFELAGDGENCTGPL